MKRLLLLIFINVAFCQYSFCSDGDTTNIIVKYNFANLRYQGNKNGSIEVSRIPKKSYSIIYQSFDLAFGQESINTYKSISVQKRHYYFKGKSFLNGFYAGNYIKIRERTFKHPGTENELVLFVPVEKSDYKSQMLLGGFCSGIQKVLLNRIVLEFGQGIGLGAALFSKGVNRPSFIQADLNTNISLGVKLGKIMEKIKN